MNYDEVVAHLFYKRNSTCRDSLAEIIEGSQKIALPVDTFPTVHVAGTNGKGSVTLKVAKALELAGLKVGLFTSPHLVSFCERIVINQVPITEEKVRVGLLSLFDSLPDLCFFDLATFLAFKYFHEEKVDVAVIEAGIGGLLDATNIITPEVSVITSIDWDHQDFLGNTLKEIAFQKAGIIKPKVPVVVGSKANFPIMHQRAVECQSPLHLVKTSAGFYDLENSAIARQALQILKPKFGLTEEQIEEGIKVRPPCRFEQIGRAVLDVAHNPSGFSKLLEAIDYHFPETPFSAVVGMSQDKDIRTCLSLLSAKASHLYLVRTTSEKTASPHTMAKMLIQKGYTHFTEGLTVTDSVKDALSRDGVVVICGSFYLMKEARQEVCRIEMGQGAPLLTRC